MKEWITLNASSQTPKTGGVVLPLHEAPLPQTVFVAKDGNVWQPAGHTDGGELLLVCPAPVDAEDCGEGPSFPWTLPLVEKCFGPLTPQADVQERALVEVDTEFLEYYGPDWRRWQAWQVENYLGALGAERAGFGAGSAGAA